MKPERRTLRHGIAQPGAIEALEQPAILAKIPGYVQQWQVDLGDPIHKGQLMAELWVPELEDDLRQKEALVHHAEAQLKLARKTVAEAEAESQRTGIQYKRLAQAGTTGVLNKDNVDEARFADEAGQARLEMARADMEVKEAQLEVDGKNRDRAHTMLQYTKIVAPFDGVVTSRTHNVDTGQFVQPATGARGDVLFTVARMDIMRILVQVPENDAWWLTDAMQAAFPKNYLAAQLAVPYGSPLCKLLWCADSFWVKPIPARVRVPALNNQEFAGKVTRTSWSLDPRTRTLLAAVDLPNPDGKLRPGMYAYATITGERANVLTVPASATVTEGDVTTGYRTFCYLLEDGKLKRTLIEVGVRDGQWVEVLKKQAGSSTPGSQPRWDAFTGNEKVVGDNVAALHDGQPVQIRPQTP